MYWLLSAVTTVSTFLVAGVMGAFSLVPDEGTYTNFPVTYVNSMPTEELWYASSSAVSVVEEDVTPLAPIETPSTQIIYLGGAGVSHEEWQSYEDYTERRFVGSLIYSNLLFKQTEESGRVARLEKQIFGLMDDTSEAFQDLSDRHNSGNGTIDVSVLDGSTLIAPIFSGSIGSNLTLGPNYLSGDGDNEGIYIDEYGQIGIGTTTPPERFSMVGGALYLEDFAPAVTANRLYANAGALYWGATLLAGGVTGTWDSNGTDVYRSTGNIGIGTTTPGSKLTVAGDMYLTGAFRDSINSAGLNGYILQTTGSGTQWVATSSLGISGGASFSNSSQLAALLSDETGTGAAVFANNPSFNGLTLATGSIAFGSTTILNAQSVNHSLTFGWEAGVNNTGSTNNLIGWYAGQNNTGSFNNLQGFQAGVGNTGAQNNMFGYFVGQNNTGSNNNIMGFMAGNSNTGSNNNLLGLQAGMGNSGEYNNALGNLAGVSNSGSYNNLFGYAAGVSNLGSYNNIFGHTAGASNSGSYNNILGYQAGQLNNGSYNEFIGFQAGKNLRSTSSVVIGASALQGAATFTSLNNVAIGYRAGYAATTGSGNNLLLGYQAADSLTTGSNNIVIGYDVEAPSNTASNQLNIGNLLFGTGIDGTGTTLSSGNIGIGTTTPGSKLTVAGDMYLTGAFRDSINSAGLNGYILQTTGSGTQWVATSSLGISGGASFSNSSQLAALLSDETGTGAAVFAFEPTFNSLINITSTGNAAIEIGRQDNVASTPFIDFHSGATSVGHDSRIIASGGNGTLGGGTLTFSTGNLVVTANNIDITAGGEIISSSSNAFRMVQGNYGSFFRNDGTNMYLLMTASGDQLGAYNAFRPFTVSLSTGAVTMQNGLFMGSTTSNISLGSNYLSGDGDDEGVYVSSTGNVGIGTTTPSAKLDIFVNSSDPALSTVTTTNINPDGKSQFLAQGDVGYIGLASYNSNYIVPNLQGVGAFGASGPMLMATDVTVPSGGTSSIRFSAGGYNNEQMRLTAAGNFGIGTTTPGSKLTVTGDMYLTGAFKDSLNSAGTLGMVLQSTVSGTTWVATSTLGLASKLDDLSDAIVNTAANRENTFIGTGAGNTTATGNDNLGVGFGALQNITNGDYNVAIGNYSGLTSTGQYNTVVGHESLLGGSHNSAFGYRSLASTSASYNAAFGNFTLEDNTNGDFNSAFGYSALSNNTSSADGNSAFGYQALLNQNSNAADLNSAFGYQAMYTNGSGNNNAVFGSYAAYFNGGSSNAIFGGDAFRYATSSASNVVMGREAALGVSGLSTGINNLVAIGYRSGYGLTTGDNNILIGYQSADSLTTGSNNIIIGYDVEAPSNTASNQLNLGNLIFGTSIDGTGTTTSSGNIGIGTSTPGSKLTVSGTILATNLLGGATNLTVDANGNIIRDPSDERLKTNITDIEDALDMVLSLRGVRYQWRDTDRFGEQTEIGFIAQEVDLVAPEVVSKGGDYWSLNTKNLVAVVVEAIQEVWEVITGHEDRLDTLEAQNAELKARLEALEENDDSTIHESVFDNEDGSDDGLDGGGEENLEDDDTNQPTAAIGDDLPDVTGGTENEISESDEPVDTTNQDNIEPSL